MSSPETAPVDADVVDLGHINIDGKEQRARLRLKIPRSSLYPYEVYDYFIASGENVRRAGLAALYYLGQGEGRGLWQLGFRAPRGANIADLALAVHEHLAKLGVHPMTMFDAAAKAVRFLEQYIGENGMPSSAEVDAAVGFSDPTGDATSPPASGSDSSSGGTPAGSGAT